MNLIPTSRKGKLVKGMSHPLGAELISKALDGVTLPKETSLYFNGNSRCGLGLFAPGEKWFYLKGSTGQVLYPFEEVLYCGFWEEDFWSIGTFHVSNECRKFARSVLMEEALPILKQWLSEKRSESWMHPQRVLQFGIHREWTELGILETHNDRVVAVDRVPLHIPKEVRPSGGFR